jgi:hypothetical protein
MVTLEDEQCLRVVMVANSNHPRKRAYVLVLRVDWMVDWMVVVVVAGGGR